MLPSPADTGGGGVPFGLDPADRNSPVGFEETCRGMSAVHSIQLQLLPQFCRVCRVAVEGVRVHFWIVFVLQTLIVSFITCKNRVTVYSSGWEGTLVKRASDLMWS